MKCVICKQEKPNANTIHKDCDIKVLTDVVKNSITDNWKDTENMIHYQKKYDINKNSFYRLIRRNYETYKIGL